MTEQIGSVVAQNFVQVGGHSGAGIHHGVTQGARQVALRRIDPHSVQTKGGLLRGLTFQGAIHLTRVDGQFFAHSDLTLAANHTLQHNVIRIRIDGQGVANAHGLNQKAQLSRQFFAYTLHAVHQLTACFGVHQGNQAVANFKANQIHLIDIVPIQFFGLVQSRLSRLLCRRGYGVVLFLCNAISQACSAQCQGNEHQVRHARHQTHNGQNGSRHEQSRGIGQLGCCLFRHGLSRGHAGHDDGGCQRQEQSWNLSYQAIANGQQGVNAASLRQRQVVLGHTNGQATHQIDDQNQQAGHRVARHKLRSTVHGAEKVRFLREFFAALFGSFLVNHTRVQIGVDGHLFARHGI